MFKKKEVRIFTRFENEDHFKITNLVCECNTVKMMGVGAMDDEFILITFEIREWEFKKFKRDLDLLILLGVKASII